MNGAEGQALAVGIRESLRMVIDPELGENVVDLGLIYQVSVEQDGIAHIEMTTTARACPATGYLKDAVRSAAWIVPGIHWVDIRLTYDPPWAPDMMNTDAKCRLGLTAT
ncbi:MULTISPECIES: metal-sulfur cluster assembly factor [unclassified Mesorhizobium]|uniref:metal-sulfur cluster assembly factor n=1 Tax=unclassified Mesorhizobium TaxID=325217 RepID=UPI0011280C81|nr:MULTISPECIES: metal-sulfur cluster assembly factor [unclassified Mesorhizobium]TPJ41001.1 metal-sulfur cluster assembly factor [Mesorhizobium sp. B2-6-6]MCA0008714.1 metal-sulfur cluster assembly factor [Mesorhizobium sp. B264B1B]MCA0019408.1 metal-sulfur cluster assembly factor [Mesorhizobium sp. B264B1A]MCA0024551.1 metal-sulfur cluster assembly factor [Mesorhizobium sp. B263B1A]MCA0055777.1 metal-sulfur cluster assembly factor [Mesorhizobium sp. B261B1A]